MLRYINYLEEYYIWHLYLFFLYKKQNTIIILIDIEINYEI